MSSWSAKNWPLYIGIAELPDPGEHQRCDCLRAIHTGDEGPSMYPYHHCLLLLAGLRLRPDIQRKTIFTESQVGMSYLCQELFADPGDAVLFNELVWQSVVVRCQIRRNACRTLSLSALWFLPLGGDKAPVTNVSPLIVVFPPYLIGGWNRKLPTGGKAYGMARYSDTLLAWGAACPRTGPLEV
jgi:hypothetical protein